ncbi:MAG: hypothetical protein KAH21_06790, partial [Spirochaetaceae bacterium]|nr:hypothetical protein [Spirochaetaceae bacterium]
MEKLEIAFYSKKDHPLVLKPGDVRSSGGGVYFSIDENLVLWPNINTDDISGDARYWMERRLYPDISMAIRAELTSGSHLYWRIHEEAENWIYTGKDGRGRIMEEKTALDFIYRLLRSESLTIAPDEGMIDSPLILKLEDTSGRFTEYRLADMNDGRVAAITDSPGILHILDDSLVQFILTGPGE